MKMLAHFVFFLTAVYLVIKLVKFLIYRSNLVSKSSKIPWSGRSGLPFVGAVFHFAGLDPIGIFKENAALMSDCKEITKTFMGPVMWVMVTKVEFMEAILNHGDALDRGFQYIFSRPLVGDGLFTANTRTWKKHRKIMSHSFSQRAINSHNAIMVKHATTLTRILTFGLQDEEELTKKFASCVMDMSFETLFDCDMDLQISHPDFAEKYEKCVALFYTRGFKVWYFPDLTYKLFSSMYKAEKKYIEDVDKVAAVVIEKAKNRYFEEIRDENNGNDDELLIIPQGNRKSLIFNIIDTWHRRRDFEDHQLRDEINTMIIGSVDTSVTTLCFILMCLGIEKSVQDRVYKEITSLLDKDAIITPEVLNKTEYFDRVIKEAMRIFTTVPIVLKTPQKDIKLGDDITIPADVTIIMSFLNHHRNPDFWPDPLKFDPDRFLPEMVAKRPRIHYVPFSAGPRDCIGYRWARSEMKCILITILRKFRVNSMYKNVADVKLYSTLLLKPLDGYKIVLEPRSVDE